MLLATHGVHPFFEVEAGETRDVRRVPLKVEGDSIRVRAGWVSVRIEQYAPLRIPHQKSQTGQQADHPGPDKDSGTDQRTPPPHRLCPWNLPVESTGAGRAAGHITCSFASRALMTPDLNLP